MQHETVFLPKNKINISFQIIGKGKPLLFLHGAGESGLMWRDAAALLADKYRCIIPDLPGHGHSQALAVTTISQYAEVVLELISELHLQDVILCGHSMGGQVGMALCLRNPAVVYKLILVNPAGLETFTASEKSQLLTWAENTYAHPFAPEVLRQFYGGHFPRHPERLERFLREHLIPESEAVKTQKRLVNLASIKAMLNEPVFEFLPQLKIPVRIIYGKQDILIPNRFIHPSGNTQQVMESAAAFIPDAETFPVAGCGHYLPVEEPELFAAELWKAEK